MKTQQELRILDAWISEHVFCASMIGGPGYLYAKFPDGTRERVIFVDKPVIGGVPFEQLYGQLFNPTTNPADCALVRKKICAEKGAITIAEWEGKWAAEVEGLNVKTDWHESEEIATCELAKLLFTPATSADEGGGK